MSNKSQIRSKRVNNKINLTRKIIQQVRK